MLREKKRILEILYENRIKSLWHFTHIENLRYINRVGGLLSKENLECRNIFCNVKFGGNESSQYFDKKKGNWNKVHLYFTPFTPMAYHKKRSSHIVFIEIDPIVAIKDGVRFTDINSLYKECKSDKGVTGIKLVNFNIINNFQNYNFNEWKKYVQAEILVPYVIRKKYFKSINFVSEASLKLGKEYAKDLDYLFRINKIPFCDFNINKKRYELGLSYIDKIRITETDCGIINSNFKGYDIDALDSSKNYIFNMLIYTKKYEYKDIFGMISNPYYKMVISTEKECIYYDMKYVEDEKYFIWKVPIELEFLREKIAFREISIECSLNYDLWFNRTYNIK